MSTGKFTKRIVVVDRHQQKLELCFYNFFGHNIENIDIGIFVISVMMKLKELSLQRAILFRKIAKNLTKHLYRYIAVVASRVHRMRSSRSIWSLPVPLISWFIV